jgi:hypothetical protein
VDPDLRANVTDAIKFWERGRIFYNLILTALVVLHFIAEYPLSKYQLTLNFGLGIFLLAVVANVAYCAAYLVDLFGKHQDSAMSGDNSAGFCSQSARSLLQSSPTSLLPACFPEILRDADSDFRSELNSPNPASIRMHHRLPSLTAKRVRKLWHISQNVVHAVMPQRMPLRQNCSSRGLRTKFSAPHL